MEIKVNSLQLVQLFIIRKVKQEIAITFYGKSKQLFLKRLFV